MRVSVVVCMCIYVCVCVRACVCPGEDVFLRLYGAAADVSVRLERSSVMVERTFVSLSSQRAVALLNRSDALLHYRWSTFASEEEEEELKLR